MSYKRVESLGDAVQHGCLIEVKCPRCGRVRYLEPMCLLTPKKEGKKPFRRNVPIARMGARMICKGGYAVGIGCGHKGAETSPAREEFLSVPKGVPAVRWLNGDPAERRRLERAARG
jgi:hypothetical protein